MTTLIAEIGCNHGGDVAVAKRMIDVICTYCTELFDAEGRVAPPIIKSQKRTPKELLSPDEYAAPHPVARHAFGPTYGAHREALELTRDEHQELQAHAKALGAIYTCSVWDLTAAQEMASLYPPFLKIPSACNLDFRMLQKLLGIYEGDIHISLGMTTPDEIETIVSFVERLGASKRTVLYACTSGYPVGFGEMYLHELTRLQRVYGHRVKAVGFSGHHLGIAADMAAVTLGAAYLERHFTLNRTWKGTDHAASLEPDGLRKLIRDVRNTELALRPRPTEMPAVEHVQRAKLKRRRTDRVIPAHVKHQEVVV